MQERQVYMVGRSRNCNIRLGDGAVSGTHASLKSRSGLWFLSDLQSRHGTRVNKQKMTDALKPLFDRDTIQMGATLMEFRQYEELDDETLAEIEKGVVAP